MLDFDGTLSPIAPTPKQALLPAKVKKELKKIARLVPAAIISGRDLRDLRKKINLSLPAFAGSHGLEWRLGGQTFYAPGSLGQAARLKLAKRELDKLAKKWPGVWVETKRFGLTVHYRLMAPADAKRFERAGLAEAKKIANARGLRHIKGKKVCELSPKLNWHKGRAVLLFWRHFQKKFGRPLLPVYVGDDVTDENAFSALRSGITIRVGKNPNSRARYYLSGQDQIYPFLKMLGKVLA